MRKNSKGVTLIALIVTIIVLIIIAGISIATLTGDNGVLQQTNAARVTQIEGTAREQVELACSAVKLAVEEAVIKDKNYSAVQNSDKIQSVLLDVLKNDKASLDGNFSYSETEAEKGQSKIEIVYEGEDYKNATNNPDAKIKYTIALDKKTIELYKVQTSIQKDSEGGDLNINIGEDLKPGLYKVGSNYNEPDITWDELVADGVVHVNDGVVTTNFISDAEAQTASNISSEILDGVLVLDESVTAIGRIAFRQCEKLTSVKIPTSVTSIDVGGFYLCTGLTSVEIPNSVQTIGKQAFAYCSSLTSINISESVTKLESGIFAYCSSLKSIEIPNSIQTIGTQVFFGCTGLTSVGPEGSGASVEIPSSVTSIEKSAFADCLNITSVKIPDTVINYGTHIFQSVGITSVGPNGSGTSCELPSTLTSIPQYMFINCTSLTNVEIPNSVQTIGKQAFFGCTKLTTAEIPNSVTSIEQAAFADCFNITSVKIPDTVKNYETNIFQNGHGLTSVGPEGSGASCELPSTLTSIPHSMFINCTNLKDVEIPEGVTSIGEYAFKKCTSLTSIRIPKTITKIEKYAFDQCTLLETIYYEGTEEEWEAIEKEVVEEGKKTSGDWDWQVGSNTDKKTYTVVYNAGE